MLNFISDKAFVIANLSVTFDVLHGYAPHTLCSVDPTKGV
jgi:hypothetical protein